MQNILLIDDDHDDREFFCEVLGEVRPDLSCHLAENGLEAFNLLEQGTKFDLLFLDLNMPHMNGFDFLEKLRSSGKYEGVPVIIYTTSNQIQDIERTRKLKAHGYFTKPTSLQVLGEKLKRILDLDIRGLSNFTVF